MRHPPVHEQPDPARQITPAAIRVRRAAATAPLVATNHHRSDRDPPGLCNRYDCLVGDAARAWGRLDREALAKLLARTSQGISPCSR